MKAVALLFASASLCCTQAAGPELDPVVEDVVVIIMDDIGWDDFLSVRTDELDDFGAVGVTFTRAYANPWCQPTRYSLLASEWSGQRRNSICQPPTANTLQSPLGLPATMQVTGFATGLFGKWHMGNNSDPDVKNWNTPMLHGFSTWRAGVPDNVFNLQQGCSSKTYTNWFRVDDGATKAKETAYNTIEIRDAFLGWWAEKAAFNRFAVVSFQAPHSPYHVPPASLLPDGYEVPIPTGPRDSYEAMIVSLDTVIGEILDTVDLSTTLVIVMGDNGTAGDVTTSEPTKAKHTTFEGGIHVPVLMAGPGVPHLSVDQPVHVVDVGPTILTFLGEPTPEVDGQPLQPALYSETLSRAWVYSASDRGNPPTSPGPDESVVTLRWKLRELQGTQTLYDLELDPDEETPLDPDNPLYAETVARLRTALAEARQ